MESVTWIPRVMAMTDWQVQGVAVVIFLLIVAVLVGLLFRGKPRQQLNVVMSDPPIRDPEDPAFIRRRARAAAAALVLHRKRHASSILDENR